MKKTWNILLLAVSALLLLALPVATAFAPREEISLYENRRIAADPVLTAETLFDGTWFADAESWLQDHAAGRDALLRLDAGLQRLSGAPFVDGVRITDTALLPDTAGPESADLAADAARMAADLAELQAQVESWGGVFLYVGVANQYSACRDGYPGYMGYVGEALDETHDAFFAALDAAGVRYLDLSRPAERSDYYRTDHHITLPAAVNACARIIAEVQAAGAAAGDPETDCTYRTLPNPFYGSRSRRLYGLVPFDEEITVFDRGPDVPFLRWDEGQAVPAVTVKLPHTDTEPVDYGIFMDGDKGETVIRTQRPELPDALLFGDSYTNAVETVFYTSFDETRSLDLRYWSGTSLKEYLDAYRPAVVVCLRDDANFLNFSGNGNIAG